MDHNSEIINNNDIVIKSALEKSLDILGEQSRNIIIQHLEKSGIDFSSFKDIKQALTELFGMGVELFFNDSFSEKLQQRSKEEFGNSGSQVSI